jgi:DNA-binding transcriptional LysR family regulator
MELRQLRYFATVAREQNFTRAAAKLHVAQPALSRQVKQLEEELGVELLARNKRGVTLTSAGKTFFAEAEDILQQSERAMQRARGGEAGALNIGYVWGLFHSIVPHALQRFRASEPEVAVNLFDLSAAEQGRALASGKLDVGFIGLAFEAAAAGLQMQRVGATQFIVALPEKHPLARRRSIDLKMLAEDVFLLISEEHFPGASQVMREACSTAGFKPRTLFAERGHTMLSLVAAGCGVALLPEPLRALPHADLAFRPPSTPIFADIFVAWRAGFDGQLKRSLLASLDQQE